MSSSMVYWANAWSVPMAGLQRSSRVGLSLPGRRGWCSCSSWRKILCTSMALPMNFGDGLASLESNSSNVVENPDEGTNVYDEINNILIECRDVHKSFGGKQILRGLSFKIRHGEAVGIIGPSGTGKSTVLKIMAGLLAPDKGDVLICGRKRHGLVDDEEIAGLRIGLVFQSAALFDSLTVRENVGFQLYENSRMPHDKIGELVKENLAAVGLKGVEDRLPSELSGGMKKRVALARSIIYDNTKEAVESEVLLYDEPTAGLDPIASTVVEDLIRSVHLKGESTTNSLGKIASYVVVTHQHSTIRRAVDRLLFLYDGKIVWEGMTHEFTTSTNPIVKQGVWMGQLSIENSFVTIISAVVDLLKLRLLQFAFGVVSVCAILLWAFRHFLRL